MGIFDKLKNRSNKPATTISLDRSLTSEERKLAEHLLCNAAEPEALAFLSQLEHARVTGRCSCGCPTVDLSVPEEFRVIDPPVDHLLADAFGIVNGNSVGVMMMHSQGRLTLLEIYPMEDVGHPLALPSIETVKRAVWENGPIKPV